MAQFFEVAYYYRDPIGLIRYLQKKTGLHHNSNQYNLTQEVSQAYIFVQYLFQHVTH